MIEVTTGTFKSFDGTSIYYEVRGKGGGHRRPMIMNYGIGCLMNHWHPQVTEFSKTHQVITYDYRGHQKSGTPLDYNNLNIPKTQDVVGRLISFGIRCTWTEEETKALATKISDCVSKAMQPVNA